MILLRRIDYILQLILAIITLLFTLVGGPIAFMAGLFLIGCWQLLSAISNTNSFLRSGMTKEICNYWKCVGLVFVLLFLMYPLTLLFDSDDIQVIGGIAVIGSIPVSAYYYTIYRKLINHYKLREELGGLIKSNHNS